MEANVEVVRTFLTLVGRWHMFCSSLQFAGWNGLIEDDSERVDVVTVNGS